MRKEILWNGRANKPLILKRPCECGCDTRDGSTGAGYLIGSNEKGEGITVWIRTEEAFNRLQEVLHGKMSQV